MIDSGTFDDLLDECFDHLSLTSVCRSYIKGTFKDALKNKDFDLSNQSLSLLYLETAQLGLFKDYQRIGDWVVFMHSTFEIDHDDPIRQLEMTLAQRSYKSCGNMIESWPVFHELSERLPVIVKIINPALKKLKTDIDQVSVK